MSVPASTAAPRRAAACLRAVLAHLAGVRRLQIVCGPLWGAPASPTAARLTLGELREESMAALPASERAALVEALLLDEAYFRDKWRRGDRALLAHKDGRPVGIAWLAAEPVLVAELGRTVRPGPGERYVHDVFVTPAARGRGVGTALLGGLAASLAEDHARRAWALVERANAASSRAFARAGYLAVAEVLSVHVAGVVDRVIITPSDPEALRLLGLT